MDPWQIVASFGVGLDLLGITLTGVGLYFTWHDHALGEAFLPAMWSEVKDVASRLARRPGPTIIRGGMAMEGSGEFSGYGHGVMPFPPDATVEDQITQLKEQLDNLGGAVAKAQHDADRAHRVADKHAQRLGERVDTLDADVRDRLREQTLRGLPLAVLGLVLTGLGTVLQLAG